jgi:hypothetical protein
VASSFPLVNYLPVAPVHEPGCQLVNHVAFVQLDSVILNTKPDWPSITASATSELSAALGHAVPGRARLDQPTHTVVIINGLADPVHDRLCPIRRCHDPDRDTASQRAAL